MIPFPHDLTIIRTTCFLFIFLGAPKNRPSSGVIISSCLVHLPCLPNHLNNAHITCRIRLTCSSNPPCIQGPTIEIWMCLYPIDVLINIRTFYFNAFSTAHLSWIHHTLTYPSKTQNEIMNLHDCNF